MNQTEINKITKTIDTLVGKTATVANMTVIHKIGGMLCEVMNVIGVLKKEKEAATRALKLKYDLAKKPYDEAIKSLDVPQQKLRDTFLDAYKEKVAIDIPGKGTIGIKTTYEGRLTDISKVPQQYLTTNLDTAKINTAIENGIRSIPGIDIVEVRSLVVTPIKTP